MTGSPISRLQVVKFQAEDDVPEVVSTCFSAKIKSPSSDGFLECVAPVTNYQGIGMGDVQCISVEEEEDTIDRDHLDNEDVIYEGNPIEDDKFRECAVLRYAATSCEPEPETLCQKLEPPSLSCEREPEAFSVEHDLKTQLSGGHLNILSPQQELKTFSSEHELENCCPGIQLSAFSPEREHKSFSDGEELEKSSAEEVACETGQLDNYRSESPSSNESTDMDSDDNNTIKDNFSSTSASDFTENDADFSECASKLCLGSWEMGNVTVEVVVSPDYVVYREKYWMDASINFSSSSIQFKGPIFHENQETINIQWGLEDIIAIESQWCARDDVALVKLHLALKNLEQITGLPSHSGLDELTFIVVDPNWPEEQEKIASLDQRYKSAWNVVHDTDMELDADALLRQSINVYRERYFPNFDAPFEEFVYPKEDSDSVAISKRDVELLQPETFINDTIIDFYIKYLKNKISPEGKHMFHFMNSFFFPKLVDLDKDPFSGSEGRAAFLRVRKWTRKVNLFEKNYVFIPINFSLHWSLIVICHPGEIANFSDEDVERATRVPCILHMDSIKGTHSGLKSHIQSYLWELWKEKQNETSESIASKFRNLRFVSLELPQQENSYDCGLFLLHYVEKFLEDAPENFSPFKITGSSTILKPDWFPPGEVSLKRGSIQKLIYELLEGETLGTSLTAYNDDNHPCEYEEQNNEDDGDVEVVAEKRSPGESYIQNQNLSGYQVGQAFELAAFSMKSSLYADDSSMALRGFFDPGVGTGSAINGQLQHFDNTPYCQLKDGAMEMSQEDTETGEQFLFTSCGTGSQSMVGFPSQACAPLYPVSDFGADMSWMVGTSEQSEDEETEDPDISSETSSSESDDDDSIDVGIIENGSIDSAMHTFLQKGHHISSAAANNRDLLQDLADMSTKMAEISGTESSRNHIDQNGGIEAENPLQSCQGNGAKLIYEDSDTKEKLDIFFSPETIDKENESASDQLVGKLPVHNTGNDLVENGDGLPSIQENDFEETHGDSDKEVKLDVYCDMQNVDADDELLSDERAAKRLRSSSPHTEERNTFPLVS